MDELEFLSTPKSPQFQEKKGKTNILGSVKGLFGGFGPLMCNPVTFSGLSIGDTSSEVTWGQIF